MINQNFYINGQWTAPHGTQTHDVINPATETSVGQIILGNTEDVNDAVKAARTAFPAFAKSTVAERKVYLEAILAQIIKRNDEIAAAITTEMGAPKTLSEQAQAPSGAQHFKQCIKVLEAFDFTPTIGHSRLRKEPVGVCALITPWNWPMNQIAVKVAPAIAAGCTMVLKPSEIAPLDAIILTEIIHEVGLPAGVFNLVQGDGQGVGNALSAHPDVDMVSFTGSTRAGIAISQNAAPNIKRVALELGGKSPCIILESADLEKAVSHTVKAVISNSGQSCNAPTRMFISQAQFEKACSVARSTAQTVDPNDPHEPTTQLGPISNAGQYEKVCTLIQAGIDEGAELITGGVERPEHLSRGYYVRPTVFAHVHPDMQIFKEEIFGPVISLIPYETLNEAIAMANDTPYGLSAYVWGEDDQKTYDIACEIRAGMVHINGAPLDSAAPFGGYKMSGNGREWGQYGLEEFLETKSVFGS